MRASKAQVSFFIELAIAMVMVASVIFFVWRMEWEPEVEVLTIKARVWQMLQTLDARGELRYHALRNDSKAIEEGLAKALIGVDYKVTLCREVCEVALPYPRVLSISYPIAGDIGNFTPVEIIVNVLLR